MVSDEHTVWRCWMRVGRHVFDWLARGGAVLFVALVIVGLWISMADLAGAPPESWGAVTLRLMIGMTATALMLGWGIGCIRR